MKGKGLVTGCVFCLVFGMTAFADEGDVSDSQGPGVVGVDLSVRKMRPEEDGPGVERWMQDEKGWFYQEPGKGYVVSDWKEVDGKWYHFDGDGYMETGLIQVDGAYYFLEEDGSMIREESREIEGKTYHFDSSGAGTVEWPYKQPVLIPSDSEKSDFHKSVDAMADGILAEIIHEGMGQREKAVAIYHWVKGNLRYSGFSPVGDWVGGAYDGMRKRHGDCYTYFATSAELLNRAGMETIEVIRSTDNNHYWNLVKVDGSWYHFDPCPRRLGGDFCLLTDDEISRSGSHTFDHSLYPPTP